MAAKDADKAPGCGFRTAGPLFQAPTGETPVLSEEVPRGCEQEGGRAVGRRREAGAPAPRANAVHFGGKLSFW
jgi:hypothetical protein